MSMLRNILRETVLMRLLLAFIIGIIGYEFLKDIIPIWINFSLLILLFSFYLFSIFNINKYNYTFKFYNGLVVFSICSMFAFQLSYFQDNRKHRAYRELISSKIFYVKVISNGRLTKSNCLYDVKILSSNYAIANSILSIKTDSIRYNMGDQLRVNGKLKAIDYISHPAQFDYKKYLTQKHIYHQLHTDTMDVVLLSASKNYSLLETSNSCRNKLLSILKKNIKDEGSYEMAAALLLGERSDLDKDLLKSYSDTGTIHIISVSGLHVGIIFLVLQFLLKLIPLFKNDIVKCIVVIICIWFYSTLTGLPASVIRSALMISFHTIGKTISSKTNSINHVAASALLLLSFNTNYLFDIGFQLSYLAVLGIMYLQKPISDLYVPQSRLSSYIWITTSVSLAAQLFTLPFCLYYFHQFPNYFIIANLIAIPLSSIALYASIANLAFASVPILNKLSEWTLVYSIKWLNSYLAWIASWPFAVSRFERIDLFQALFYCLILFFLILYFKEEIRISLHYCFISGIILMSYIIINKANHKHKHLWVQHLKYQTSYTLESNNDLIHFIYIKEKQKNISSYLNLWKSFTNKHQKVIFIDKGKFELMINKLKYSNKPQNGLALGNKYDRICLK